MTKRFATQVDVCEHIMPTWSRWDLLTVAFLEKCQELNNQGASKYRISDGKQAIDVWVILDPVDFYQRASVELENKLDSFYCNRQTPRRQSVATNSPRTDRRKIVASIVAH